MDEHHGKVQQEDATPKKVLNRTEDEKAMRQLIEMELTSGNAIMEREWRKRDNQMYEESKKWFIKEITERDSRIAQLNIDIRAKETKWKNDEMHITQMLNKMKEHVGALEEKLESKEEALVRVTRNMEKQYEKNRMEVKNLEADLKVKEELAQLYKDQFEKADTLVDQLGGEIHILKELNAKAKDLLEEVRNEREEERLEIKRHVENTEKKIIDLNSEIYRLNEASKYAICLSEEELSRLFPNSEDFSKFLESDSSITSVLKEQARISKELEAEKQKNSQLESELKAVVEEIEKTLPDFTNQRVKLNEILTENIQLKKELQKSEEDKSQIESTRDQAFQHLAICKTELERCEKDRIQSQKRIQRLLFVAERERKLEGQKLSNIEEKQLFDSIENILKLNSHLESELIAERNSISSRTLVEQNKELAILRKELEKAMENERYLHSQLEQISKTFNEVREQNQKICDWTGDNSITDQLREAKMKLLTTTSDLEGAQIRIGRLEATVNTLQEEKKSIIEMSEARLTNSQTMVHELKAVNAKLEAKFEYQNQIAETNSKEMDSIQKEIARVNKENAELLISNSENATNIDALHIEIMRINEEYSRHKIEFTVQTSELSELRTSSARLEAHLQVYQSRYQTDQQLYNSLLNLNERLQRVDEDIEAQKISLKHHSEHIESQLAINDEIKKLKEELKQKESNLKSANQQISKLDADIIALQSKFEQARGLARKYRDELTIYKSSQTEGIQEQTTSIENEGEIEILKKQLDVRNNELTEATFRLNLLSSKMERMEEAKKLADQEIKRKDEQITKLLLQTSDVNKKNVETTPTKPDPSKTSPVLTSNSSRISPGILLFGRTAPMLSAATYGQLETHSFSKNENKLHITILKESELNKPASNTGESRKRPAEQSYLQIEPKRQKDDFKENSGDEKMDDLSRCNQDENTGSVPNPTKSIKETKLDNQVYIDDHNYARRQEIDRNIELSSESYGDENEKLEAPTSEESSTEIGSLVEEESVIEEECVDEEEKALQSFMSDVDGFDDKFLETVGCIGINRNEQSNRINLNSDSESESDEDDSDFEVVLYDREEAPSTDGLQRIMEFGQNLGEFKIIVKDANEIVIKETHCMPDRTSKEFTYLSDGSTKVVMNLPDDSVKEESNLSNESAKEEHNLPDESAKEEHNLPDEEIPNEDMLDEQEDDLEAALTPEKHEEQVNTNEGTPDQDFPNSTHVTHVPIRFEENSLTNSNETESTSQQPPSGGLRPRRTRPTLQPYQAKRGGSRGKGRGQK